MHTCDNVHQTHELTCVIGPADAHSHLRKSATWKLVWRGLPVCQETRTVNSAFHLRTVKPEGKNDFLRSHFQQTTQPVGTQNKAQLMFRRIFQPPSLWFSGCSRKNLPQVTLGKEVTRCSTKCIEFKATALHCGAPPCLSFKSQTSKTLLFYLYFNCSKQSYITITLLFHVTGLWSPGYQDLFILPSIPLLPMSLNTIDS